MFAKLIGRKKGASTPADWFTFDHVHQHDDLKSLLGGKGAGLVEMVKLGIPVPPGFTIPTTVCLSYLDHGWTAEMGLAVEQGIAFLQQRLKRQMGDRNSPLLVSVRSGSAFSMPGMMDTVLNAGMTEDVARGLAERSGDTAFAWDTYKRALTSYVQIVLGASAAQTREIEGRCSGADVEASALAYGKALADAGFDIPGEPLQQVVNAVKAVFASWHSDRARAYREKQGIDHGIGTAASIQAMVFGNLGQSSGTGVAFSRDPSTGEAGLIGDFLVGAQGEDVVAGTHQTLPLRELENRWPQLWAELCKVSNTLERHCCDMVDLEFTIEEGVLWLLQTRTAKRSPRATFRAAVEMANDPAFPLDQAKAVERCSDLLSDPPTQNATDLQVQDLVLLGTGLAASPGMAVGVLSLDPNDAVVRKERGERVILAREETSPDDVHGMGASVGLITTLGGMVSHAAVVARSWGLAAAVGCEGITFENGQLVAGEHRVEPGTWVSVCGDTGHVYLGKVQGESVPLPEVETVQGWARALQNRALPALDTASKANANIDPRDCLRLIGLKGMTTSEALAEPFAADVDTVQTQVDLLVEQGLVGELGGGRLNVTDEGKAQLANLLHEDKAIATTQCDDALHPFHQPNLALKEIVTAWQMREVDGELQPNDHSDNEYDASVIARLESDVHKPIEPILRQLGESLPRLMQYQDRLDLSLQKLQGGDQRYMAHPLLDSYHTIWFELHEELIKLSGRDRKTETEAGRA